MIKKYDILPVPKPRMSKQDAWLKRPPVVRYWNFKANCKLLDFQIPDKPFKIYFILPMPDSWSKKKRDLMRHKPHKQRPDGDNLLKAAQDSVLDEDSHINQVTLAKFWGDSGCMVIDDSAEELPFPEIAK